MTHRIPDLWDAEPGYLNTASYGLPPRSAWVALQAALTDWRAGRTSWEDWAAAGGKARHSFARLVEADPADVAVGSQVSALVGLVAAAFADRVRPLAAGWFAGDDVHASYYGPPLRLAKDARRFDVSPGWFDAAVAALTA